MARPAESVAEPRTPDLGGALRAARKQAGLTMQAVADGAGLSVGFISQVERNLTVPSLGSLASIADVLQKPIGAFLDQPAARPALTRSASREIYAVPGDRPRYERLSAAFPGHMLHSVIMHEPPGHRVEPISHRGEEIIYLLAGEITVELDGKPEILREGDSIHFDSRRIHSTWNHSGRVATLLWCGTMDIFGDTPDPIHKDATQRAASDTSTTSATTSTGKDQER